MTSVLQKEIVAENAILKEEIKALITENDSLKAKIVELEDKLGLNSQNSSLAQFFTFTFIYLIPIEFLIDWTSIIAENFSKTAPFVKFSSLHNMV